MVPPRKICFDSARKLDLFLIHLLPRKGAGSKSVIKKLLSKSWNKNKINVTWLVLLCHFKRIEWKQYYLLFLLVASVTEWEFLLQISIKAFYIYIYLFKYCRDNISDSTNLMEATSSAFSGLYIQQKLRADIYFSLRPPFPWDLSEADLGLLQHPRWSALW